jgi:apolipoprotein D and lipocalin family protein
LRKPLRYNSDIDILTIEGCILAKVLLIALLSILLAGCLGSPEGVVAIDGFDKQRYLGRWYEVARLDHSFERGLSNVTAEYSLREDGGIRVINRGYSSEASAWQEAEGRAYFVADERQGHLKVSFFGPFYGSYIIFEMDKSDYGYAFVAGNSTDYLWLLARTPTISPLLREQFIQQVTKLGFDPEALIFVDQGLNKPPAAEAN